MNLQMLNYSRGFHHPTGSFFGSQSRTRRHTWESRIHIKELQNAQHHNHIYNNTFINVRNSTSKYNVSE